MPTSRYLMAADITANYMYVVGGLPLTATPAGGLSEMYATQADTWATGTRFSSPEHIAAPYAVLWLQRVP